MNELDPSTFPRNINYDEVKYLAELAFKNPLSQRWIMIAKLLTPEQKIEINKKIESIKFENTKHNHSSKSEGQGMDDSIWNHKLWEIEVNKFYGNMGQPETPQEFKNRFGVWPPGYDKDGNKLDELI